MKNIVAFGPTFAFAVVTCNAYAQMSPSPVGGWRPDPSWQINEERNRAALIAMQGQQGRQGGRSFLFFGPTRISAPVTLNFDYIYDSRTSSSLMGTSLLIQPVFVFGEGLCAAYGQNLRAGLALNGHGFFEWDPAHIGLGGCFSSTNGRTWFDLLPTAGIGGRVMGPRDLPAEWQFPIGVLARLTISDYMVGIWGRILRNIENFPHPDEYAVNAWFSWKHYVLYGTYERRGSIDFVRISFGLGPPPSDR